MFCSWFEHRKCSEWSLGVSGNVWKLLLTIGHLWKVWKSQDKNFHHLVFQKKLANHVSKVTFILRYLHIWLVSIWRAGKQEKLLQQHSLDLIFWKLMVVLNPFWRIFLNFEKSCISTCWSLFNNKKNGGHQACFRVISTLNWN